ncbi:hypothetical protein CDAR_210421 [Caerostris darwini]|uniref:Uncharacterized protein n=1 Tax=Caerostris darwini TaxID=1538125 RepID=A0AAV4MKS8_9ARAC|nr:hypothetical protein CDAR_210421 [Caerostris darwini]
MDVKLTEDFLKCFSAIGSHDIQNKLAIFFQTNKVDCFTIPPKNPRPIPIKTILKGLLISKSTDEIAEESLSWISLQLAGGVINLQRLTMFSPKSA